MNPYFFPSKIIIATLILLILGALPINAQYFEISSPKIRLWADRIIAQKDHIAAHGDVLICSEPYTIYAGHMSFDLNTKVLIADQSVLLQFKDTCVSGKHLFFDFESETGTINQGQLFYEPASLFIQGNKIEKTGPHTYKIDHFGITTCDLCDPDWKISGKDLRVKVNGYASLWHGILSVKNMPVFYTPFFVFPVKEERQTGLLFPFVEHSGRKGWLFQQPFYWIMGKSADTTFYSTYMEKRGLMQGLEFRYNIGPQTRGTFMVDNLDDRQPETINTQKQWGYDHDDYIRSNTNRYWIRAKIDQPLPFNSMAQLDLDWVSDPDYLKTFDSSYTGFESTRKNMLQRHQREMDDSDETFRTNRLHVQRIFERSRIYGELQWIDDVYYRNNANDQPPIHHLPVIRYSSIQDNLWNLPLIVDFDTRYAYEYQKDNDNQDTYSLVSNLILPIHTIPGLYIEPAFLWKGGYFHNNAQSESVFQKAFKTSVTSQIYKIYCFGSNHADRNVKKSYKHSIQMHATYWHMTDASSEMDRWHLFGEELNKIKWLVSNTWIEKMQSSHAPVYKQRLKLAFSGDYNILENRENDITSCQESQINQKFSPVKADLTWTEDIFSLNSDALWSIYDHELIQCHVAFHIFGNKSQQFKLNYQYAEDSNESLDTEITTRLSKKIKLIASYAHDIHNYQRTHHSLGLEYQGPCWRLDGMFYDNANTRDQRFSMMIHLDGISNQASPLH